MSTYLFRLHLCLYPIFLYSMFYNLRMEFGKCSIVCSLYAVYVSSISYIRCPLCYVLCSLFRICIAVYVDVILHICRCIYVCAYVDVLFLSTFRSFAVYVFVSVYVYPYVDVCFCMGVCIRMCICIRICFSTCICICVSSMYACLCARATTAWWQLVWEGLPNEHPPSIAVLSHGRCRHSWRFLEVRSCSATKFPNPAAGDGGSSSKFLCSSID